MLHVMHTDTELIAGACDPALVTVLVWPLTPFYSLLPCPVLQQDHAVKVCASQELLRSNGRGWGGGAGMAGQGGAGGQAQR